MGLSVSICQVKDYRTSKEIKYFERNYDNPQYYAGYYTRDMIGNLRLNGMVAAEQNHSSITSMLGKGAMWDIWEQLRRLCERHQLHCDIECRDESKHTVSTHRYRSPLQNELAEHDVAAKKALAAYPYGMFYKSLKMTEMLQAELQSDNVTYHIWPSNETFNSNEHVKLVIGDRCQCSYRRDYDIQCGHELKVDPTFRIENWNERWLTRKEFNMRNPHLMCFPTSNGTGDG